MPEAPATVTATALPKPRSPEQPAAGVAVSPTILAVDAWGVRCALRAEQVSRVMPLAETTPVPGGPPSMVGLLRIGNELVPTHDLGWLLRIPPTGSYSTEYSIVVVECAAGRVALVTGPEAELLQLPGDARPVAVAGDAPLEGALVVDSEQYYLIDVESLVRGVLGTRP